MTIAGEINLQNRRVAFVHYLWRDDIVREAYRGFVDARATSRSLVHIDMAARSNSADAACCSP